MHNLLLMPFLDKGIEFQSSVCNGCHGVYTNNV